MTSRNVRTVDTTPVDAGVFVCPGTATIATYETGTGRAIASRVIEIGQNDNGSRALAAIARRTRELAGSRPISGAGVAVAAKIDPSGTIVGGGRLGAWRGTNVTGIFAEHLDTHRVFTENDSVALCRSTVANSMRFHGLSLVQVRIGKGFGASLAQWHVSRHVITNLEAGHRPAERPASFTERQLCSCGGYDHVESFCSGWRFNQLTGRHSHMIFGPETLASFVQPGVDAITEVAGQIRTVVLGGPVFQRSPRLFHQFKTALNGGWTVVRANTEHAPANAGLALLRDAERVAA